MSLLGFLCIYILGGVTFLPIVVIVAFLFAKKSIQPFKPESKSTIEPLLVDEYDEPVLKKGWIRLINQYHPKMPEISSNSSIMSYVGGGNQSLKKGVAYAVLERDTLYCYESEKQQEKIMMLSLNDYEVSLYPDTASRTEGELFSRSTMIRIVPKNLKNDINLTSKTPLETSNTDEETTCNPAKTLYLTCARNTDKEDWYFGLLRAKKYQLSDTNEAHEDCIWMDNTHFDRPALERLIHQVYSTPGQRETAWLNAIVGRLFLSIYKTDRLKEFVDMKIRQKINKTKRPTFLDEIHVRNVDVGQSVPSITNPKLLSLTPEGEVVVEAQVDYSGGLTIEIETDFNWSYSSRMKPIRMHLVLAVKLKKLAGRLMFKIKAPPTNRYWVSFFEMPEMEWNITPVVADKQIKLNIVTNAIESRIREVMAETFVLPNMDDTPFYQSEGKGGIFGSYVKVPLKKTTSYKHKPERKDSTVSTTSSSSSSSNASHGSSKVFVSPDHLKEAPTVPELHEKSPASDVLKLKSRRAESVTGLTLDQQNSMQKLEGSRSAPDMQPILKEENLLEDKEEIDGEIRKPDSFSEGSIDQRSITETGSSTSKWSSSSLYIRKRVKKPEEDHSDTESINSFRSNQSNNGSKFFNKINQFLPSADREHQDSVRQAHAAQSSTNNSSMLMNKKNAIVSAVGQYLSKKMQNNDSEDESPKDEDETMNESKRERYAERLANMQKRAKERSQSSSSFNLSDSDRTDQSFSAPSTNQSHTSPINPSEKPGRYRAASTVQRPTDIANEDRSNKPPLPPRRYSTPPPMSQEVTIEAAKDAIKPPIFKEEKEFHQQQQEQEQPTSPPPLPTSPRPLSRPDAADQSIPPLPPRL
ncbi:putative integral membrane protein conserved region-domain-containing protein [Choanephora cucurbitarum]|nr:putative integral membrane protein conserved region-domain-containing protein [Choanephora cucurbitarum]